MRTRQVLALATAGLLTGMLGAAPARAQAPLGLTIDPTQGLPGTVVSAQVNPADVAANCVTDLAEFQARFEAQFVGPFVGGNTEGDLPQTWFPDPNNIVYENVNQVAYVLTLFAVLGIAQDINGAAQTALPQSFALTFADLLTQQPVGDLSTFDPVTGAGTVVAPNVTPGPWAVAAACVAPSLDIDTLRAGIERSGAFLTSVGIQFGPEGPTGPEFEAFAQEFLDSDLTGFDLLIAFITAIGPNLVQNIVTPEALGVQVFTILGQPPERIADLLDDIDALVAGGQLRANQARGISQHLTNALRSLEKGKLEPTCAQLDAFIKVVNAKVKAGALDPAAAAALIAEAESIQAQLGCGVASPSGAFLE